LIEKETLSGKQIKNLLLGLPLDNEQEPEFPAIASSKKEANKKEEESVIPKKTVLKETKARTKKEYRV